MGGTTKNLVISKYIKFSCRVIKRFSNEGVRPLRNSVMKKIRGIGLHNKIGKSGRLDMRFQLYIVCSAKPGGRPEPVGVSSLFKRSNCTRWDRFSAAHHKNLRSSFYGGQPGIVCTIPYLNRNADRLTAKVTVCLDHLYALLSCGKIISRSTACATALQQIISRSRSNLYTSMGETAQKLKPSN